MEKPDDQDALVPIDAEHCFICGGNVFVGVTTDYCRCTQCGHETLKSGSEQSYIINDPLTADEVEKAGLLDNFKRTVLRRFLKQESRSCLVDIGSASGKFLKRNENLFDRVIGIEVTPDAIEFARQVLNLDIRKEMSEIDESIAVVTCWHSLEHIPEAQLCDLLSKLQERVLDGGRLIVSVPNGSSLQYRLFRTAYAFYDVPNHIHQFTPRSLRMLLGHYGFMERKRVFSWPYNIFGYVQGLLNVITRSHNYLYYRAKRRTAERSHWRDSINSVLLPLVLPIGVMLALVDLVFPLRQGVLTICFEKS